MVTKGEQTNSNLGQVLDNKYLQELISHREAGNEIVLLVDDTDLPVGNPEFKSIECGCGHVLYYGPRRYENLLNGERVIFNQVNYYFCNNCDHKIFLGEVSDEMTRRLKIARENYIASLGTATG